MVDDPIKPFLFIEGFAGDGTPGRSIKVTVHLDNETVLLQDWFDDEIADGKPERAPIEIDLEQLAVIAKLLRSWDWSDVGEYYRVDGVALLQCPTFPDTRNGPPGPGDLVIIGKQCSTHLHSVTVRKGMEVELADLLTNAARLIRHWKGLYREGGVSDG